MMKLISMLPLLLLILVTSACVFGSATAPAPAKPDETLVAEIVEATLTAIAAETQPTETPIALPPELTAPIWLENEERAVGPALPSILSGLVYRDDSVWLVDTEGIPHMLMGQPANGRTSPDGTGFLFSSNLTTGEDILYYNIATDSVMAFTDTPDVHERNYQWWPARRNTIVFNFIPQDELGPWSGYLAAFDITYSEYIIIDGEYGSGSTFALSPDGEKIAFLQNTRPAIYSWGDQSRAIDMQSYGLVFDSYRAPAWSADGSKLAFYATGEQKDGGVQASIVMIDFERETSRILHEYISYGMRIGPELAFSPDDKWLASVNPGEITADNNPVSMWVYALENDQKIHLGYASSPFWRPGGEYLLFTAWPDVGSTELHKIMLAEIGVWEPFELEQLDGAFINDWILLSE